MENYNGKNLETNKNGKCKLQEIDKQSKRITKGRKHSKVCPAIINKIGGTYKKEKCRSTNKKV